MGTRYFTERLLLTGPPGVDPWEGVSRRILLVIDSMELGNLLPEIPNLEKADRKVLILGCSWAFSAGNSLLVCSMASARRVSISGEGWCYRFP